jgi:hypothetical protein
VLLTLLCVALLVPSAAFARKSKRAEKADAEATQTNDDGKKKNKKGAFKPFDEVTEGTEHEEGFFEFYTKPGTVLMAVPEKRLGEEFLMGFEVAEGIGRNVWLNGGAMLSWEGRIVALERHGNNIYLLQRPIHFTASNPDHEGQVDFAFGSSVLASAEIVSMRDDDKAALIDVQKWFVSDISGIGQVVRFAASSTPGRPGRAQLDAKRSYLEFVKVFPENVNIRTKLTFSPGEPVNINSVPDSRYIPVSIYAVLAQLPEQPMEPRAGDDRVGYFLTVHKDYSQQEKTFFKRYVRRWRLEKGKKRGDLWEPKKPITYYIDRAIPAELQPYVKAGVEEWNVAFEAAGWKNAVRADVLPREADAEDIRYATIRWVATDLPSYGAIGPSMVDPRTGEVLDADILFDAVIMLGARNAWRRLVDPAAMVEQLMDPAGMDLGLSRLGFEHQSFATQLAMQLSLVHSALLARGEIEPGDPVPVEFLGEFLKWVVMHEVGHTLGLRHNFRGSIDTPFDKLHDRMWTSENGLFNSVMEYPTANIAADGEANGHYYSTTVGTYDRWVIEYGYTPDPARAAALARQAAYDGHAYGTDEDTWGAGALDPTINVFDLSDDPLAWSEQRTALIRGLWNDLPKYMLVENAPYYDLTSAMSWHLGGYFSSMLPAVKYIGGQYVNRDHFGDPQGRKPFLVVPKAKQQEALDLLMNRVFSEDSFAFPRETFEQMGAYRWSHWGYVNNWSGRIDFPLHEIALNIQRAFLNQITHPYRLSRIADGELKFGYDQVLTMPELLNGLTTSIWSEIGGQQTRNIPSMRRNLQRLYVDRMTKILTNPPSRMPADARSVARTELQQLKARIDRALSAAGNLGPYTRSHLKEVSERIDHALEAGLEVEMMGS